MNFTQALEAMDQDVCVRRSSWPESWYAYRTALKINGGERVNRLTRPGDPCSPWDPSEEDQNADDWMAIPGLVASYDPEYKDYRTDPQTVWKEEAISYGPSPDVASGPESET